jgi:hypothetical protein
MTGLSLVSMSGYRHLRTETVRAEMTEEAARPTRPLPSKVG